MRSAYDEAYSRSMWDPEGFWAQAAEDIHWERRWDRVFDDSRQPFSRCLDPNHSRRVRGVRD